MGSTTVSAGKSVNLNDATKASSGKVLESIERLADWLEQNDYRGYDTFDGLNAKVLRALTLETKPLRIVLQQGVRRFPLNLRPLLGNREEPFNKRNGLFGAWLYPASSGHWQCVWGEKGGDGLAMAHR